MSQVLKRQQHWLTCSQYLPIDACTRWGRGGRRNANCQLDHAASGCSPGDILSLDAEANGHHGYASSSRLVDMCNWCGCSVTRSGAGTAGSSASKSGGKKNRPGTLRHAYLSYSVASDSKLLGTSRGLGTGGPAAPRHRGQKRARGGESMERAAWKQNRVTKS